MKFVRFNNGHDKQLHFMNVLIIQRANIFMTQKYICRSLKDYEYSSPQECRDPILTYLQKYYLGEGADSCVSDAGELSWDEGDMPHLCLKVWTFNDFMEQYNEIYAWLNNIQVTLHLV